MEEKHEKTLIFYNGYCNACQIPVHRKKTHLIQKQHHEKARGWTIDPVVKEPSYKISPKRKRRRESGEGEEN